MRDWWRSSCPVALTNTDDRAHSQFAQVRAIVALIRQEAAQHEFLTTFALLSKVIEQHIAAGALTEAQRLVAELEHLMRKMPEGYWRTRYLAELNEKWAYLTSTDTGTPLLPGEMA
jgi:hypothetical protein